MGNLYWCTNGNANFSRHYAHASGPLRWWCGLSLNEFDGYLSPIPGLVILMPSTSWDVYGLLMTAAEYKGPVICLEPKWMYRQHLGPVFPNEPTDANEIAD